MLKAGFGAGLAMISLPSFVFPGQKAGEELVPFQNVPRATPESIDWETLDEWLTPQDQVFSVQHYGMPKVDAGSLPAGNHGPRRAAAKLTLDDIKALPRARPADDARMLGQRLFARLLGSRL